MTGKTQSAAHRKTAEAYRKSAQGLPKEVLTGAHSRILESGLHMFNLDITVAYAAANQLAWVMTKDVDTLAVTILPSGFTAQLFNPEFVLRLQSKTDLAYVRTHEMMHLFLRHLWGEHGRTDVHVLAEEAAVNHMVGMIMYPRVSPANRPMPMLLALDEEGNPVLDKDGKPTYEPTGVNPYRLWKSYADDLKKQGETPVEYSTFVGSEARIYAELMRMKRNPMSTKDGKESSKCETGATGGENGTGDAEGDSSSKASIDQGISSEIISSILEDKVSAAIAGDDKARDEITKLMEMTEGSDEASKLWGSIGAGALRGETVKTRRVSFWERFVSNKLSSRIVPGEKLKVNHKRWWTFAMHRRGQEFNRHVVIAVDTSGSMCEAILDRVAQLLGDEDGLYFEFVAFDAEVYPFTLGEAFKGGGGTSFAPIDTYVSETLEEEPDAVLVVTDGYAPHITPTNPDKWVWLITPDGDPWPDTHEVPMDCYQLTAEELELAG